MWSQDKKPGNLLEMQICRTNSRLTDPRTLGRQGPEVCALSSCPGNSDACCNLGTSGLKVVLLFVEESMVL